MQGATTVARQYIAAAEKEWLYPEKPFTKTMWNKLGDRFFLMPDPRKTSFTTDIVMGFSDGRSLGVDEYGRTGGQRVGRMQVAPARVRYASEAYEALG